MRAHSVDYRREHGEHSYWLHRGAWLFGTPRLMPLCRLLGHRPVVDGYDSQHSGSARWVCCDRCGVRPDPQGSLNPAVWRIGQPYTGPVRTPGEGRPDVNAPLEHRTGRQRPGVFPAHPTGEVGAELVLGPGHGGWGFQVKVGNAGSEHTLAGHIKLGPLGALFLHTERHGTWLQRRLNPTGYESRVIGVDAWNGLLAWKAWARRDSWSRGTPRWQDGSCRIDPRDLALGNRRYSYEDVGEPVAGVVRMPQGDDHTVTMQLQRQTLARRRGRFARTSWCVQWLCRSGIPDGKHKIVEAAVQVPDGAALRGEWPAVALAAVASDMTETRSRYGYTPVGVS